MPIPIVLFLLDEKIYKNKCPTRPNKIMFYNVFKNSDHLIWGTMQTTDTGQLNVIDIIFILKSRNIKRFKKHKQSNKYESFVSSVK